MVVMEDVTELYVSVHGSLDHTFLMRGEAELSPFKRFRYALKKTTVGKNSQIISFFLRAYLRI